MSERSIGRRLRNAALIGIGAVGLGVGIEHMQQTPDAPKKDPMADAGDTAVDVKKKSGQHHEKSQAKEAAPSERVPDFEGFKITRRDLDIVSNDGLPNVDKGTISVEQIQSALENDDEWRAKYNELLDQLTSQQDDENSIHFYLPDDPDFNVVASVDVGHNPWNGNIAIVTMTDPTDGSLITVLHDYELKGFDEQQLKTAVRLGLQKVVLDKAYYLLHPETEE